LELLLLDDERKETATHFNAKDIIKKSEKRRKSEARKSFKRLGYTRFCYSLTDPGHF
jgi:hypothetical protein